MSITIVAVSDFHGNLPKKIIPPCDILVIAGDMCPARHTPDSWALQAAWLDSKFRKWLEDQPAKHIVGCGGNHDWIFQHTRLAVPKGLKWTYLQDSFTEIEGVKIYGTPWTNPFLDWAFNATEEEQKELFGKIPDGIDILMSHGPPHGILDVAKDLHSDDMLHVGSRTLKQRVFAVKPKLHLFGHIHSGHGLVEHDGITFANVSVLDEDYKMVYPPQVFHI